MKPASNQAVTRNANTDDMISLSILMNELGYPTTVEEMSARFENVLNHPDYKTFVAVYNNEVVGMAGATKNFSYEKNGMYVRILALVIHHSYREKGFTKKLLEAVESWAKEIGAISVLLNCGNREERKVAHQFYKANGYEVKSSGYVKGL